MKYLVEHGADVNVANNDDVTALMLASKIGYFEILKYLVEHGADVNAKDKFGFTAFKLSAYLDISKYLAENGAHINLREKLALKLSCFKKKIFLSLK